ncbi:MAG: FG-GAP repeat domain-containing protein, partial [Armatimonadota bacterium]
LFVEADRDTRIRLAGTVGAAREGTAELQIQDGAIQLSAGRHVISLRGWDGFGKLAALTPQAFAAAGRAADQRLAEARGRAGQEEIQGLQVQTVKLDMAVAVLVVADVTGDATAEWLVGGDKGVAVYKPDGTRLWLFATEEPVQCLDVADLDGDGTPEVAVGGADEHVRVLDANGRERWSFRCKASQGSIDGPPAVDYVNVVDLEGDGKKELVVGANWVHVLDAAGKLKWEKYMAVRRGRISGDFVAGDVADLDGDGTQEVIGLFMTSYPLAIAYDADGNIVMPADGPGGHGGLNIDVPFSVATMDLFGGQTTKQIVSGGTSQIGLYWHDQKNKEQAGGQVGGTFVSMAHWQPDPAQRPTIFGADSMCGVWAIRPEPRRNDRWITANAVWYRSLDEKITRLLATDLDGDGSGEVVAGTKTGSIYVLSAEDGSVRGRAKSERPTAAGGTGVTSLAWDGASQSVLVGRGDGSVLRVQAKP